MARNQKPKKDSLITLTKKYANNHDECVKYFFKNIIKYDDVILIFYNKRANLALLKNTYIDKHIIWIVRH